MFESAVFEDIIDIGKRRGTVTLEEINNAFPEDFFPQDKLEDLMDLLQDMGVKIVDDWEADSSGGKVTYAFVSDKREKAEDLIQAYFHSMGNISILTRDEEAELAKRIEEGKEIIRAIISLMPIYKHNEAEAACWGETDDIDEHERSEIVINNCLEILGKHMRDIIAIERKIAQYGTLKDLRKLIRHKKGMNINPVKLCSLEKEVLDRYKKVELSVGVKIIDLRERWDKIRKAIILASEAKNELITHNLRLVINIAKN
jgi:RNA polymerase primary sigma factor